MSHAFAFALPLLLALVLAACSGNPPKPVLPDGLHRVPVNRIPSAPIVPPAATSPSLPASPTSSMHGAGS
jgi:hypothetical protein